MIPPLTTHHSALALGDDNLVLAQRLGEWISRGPDLETDIALGNITLDHLGVARALLGYAGDEDELAMLRSEREFNNLLICEQPNGDFAQTMARQLLIDAYQVGLWEKLAGDDDQTLAGISGKALLEARYHLRFSSAWVVRLGDGTDESRRRMEAGLACMWRFVDEMFEEHPDLRPEWDRRVDEVLTQATLARPEGVPQRSGGRRGFHTEHLGHLLAEMQWLPRSHPGAKW